MWSAFRVYAALQWRSGQRAPQVPSHLCDCADPGNSPFKAASLAGDFSSNQKRNALPREHFMSQWVPGGHITRDMRFVGTHMSAGQCVHAGTYACAQGNSWMLCSSLEALQGPNAHRLDGLRWKIKRNTCVLLGSEHPGRRGTIQNRPREFTTGSNGVKSGKEKQFEHQ